MKFSDLVEMGFNQGLEWTTGSALSKYGGEVQACLLGAAFVGVYGVEKSLETMRISGDAPYHFVDALAGCGEDETICAKIYHINDNVTCKEDAIQRLKDSKYNFDVLDTSLENIDLGQLVSVD